MQTFISQDHLQMVAKDKKKTLSTCKHTKFISQIFFLPTYVNR